MSGLVSGSELPRAILLDPSDSGLVLVRRLQQRGVPVSVLACTSYTWVTCLSGIDGRVLGSLKDDRDSWYSALAELSDRGGGVLLCASDQATEVVARERSRLGPRLRAFEGVDTPHLRLMDKVKCYAVAEGVGIRTPWSALITSHADLEALAASCSYPCLLKPVLSHVWRSLFGDQRVIVACDADGLRAAAAPALNAGLELLLTQYVRGPEKNLEGAVLVRRPDGALTLAYARRKLRQHPLGFGAGALFESIDSPEVIDLARLLLDAVGYVGIAAVEAKRDAFTGELVLIEVNVRIPQSFGLGDACGVDASWRLYATLADLPLPPQPPQRYGVRSVVPSVELPAAAALLRQGDVSPRALLASYRHVRDIAGLSLRQPLPLLAFIRLKARRAAVRVIRRGLRRGRALHHREALRPPGAARLPAVDERDGQPQLNRRELDLADGGVRAKVVRASGQRYRRP